MIWRTVAAVSGSKARATVDFTVENVGRQNLGRELFFVELLAQLQVLDRCRKA